MYCYIFPSTDMIGNNVFFGLPLTEVMMINARLVVPFTDIIRLMTHKVLRCT